MLEDGAFRDIRQAGDVLCRCVRIAFFREQLQTGAQNGLHLRRQFFVVLDFVFKDFKNRIHSIRSFTVVLVPSYGVNRKQASSFRRLVADVRGCGSRMSDRA
ncbi:hypothetical protein SDC9_147863 [bioreactor metagenome]|uniref:Uncharacterized protein n=1 Tax=bioreactor metagenome TaxID=1076179 RepID=A0A645EFZ3_9ZZZZ